MTGGDRKTLEVTSRKMAAENIMQARLKEHEAMCLLGHDTRPSREAVLAAAEGLLDRTEEWVQAAIDSARKRR